MKTTIAMFTRNSAYRASKAVALGAVAAFWSLAAAAATLTDVSYVNLTNNELELKLTFDAPPPEPQSFTTGNPARINFDLEGVKSTLASRQHALGTGNARSLVVMEAKDRTRVTINLLQLQAFETRTEGNVLTILLGGAEEQTAAATSIQRVDFRRGGQGEALINVQLSSPSIPVDVKEQGGKIIARFVGAGLPSELQRRLDVTDFATPASFVDTRHDGNSTIITIEPTGTWEYMAYQADNQYSISVKPLTSTEVAKRKQDAFQYTGDKLSLSFHDIEVRSVLRLVAGFTGLNLVASDTVTGRITLELQGVPSDQALDLILRTKGLDKRQVGNVLLVAPADEIAAREEQELESQKKIEALAPLRTEYFRINYAKAKDLESLIKTEGSLLSHRGSIAVDERTNTLIILDTEAKLDEIREVITYLDVQVQQVLIEARVVVASTDVAKEMGVRWGGLAWNQSGNGNRSLVMSGRTTNVREFGTGWLSGDEIEVISPDDMVVDMGVGSSSASRFAVGIVDRSLGMIDLELSALDSEGKAELVATPKVLTADQQKAEIASGTQVGYETSAGNGATTVEYVQAELRLEVTPAITPEGKVVMEIQVNNDRIGGWQAMSNGSQVPLIETNRVATSVLVNDGETVVLGGIFQENNTKLTLKTPLLGDLPWIGRLFRKNVNENSKAELLIFITPRLIKDAVATR